MKTMKMMIEQVRHADSLNEMRAEIKRMAMHDALTRRVMDIASMERMSDEDRYTMLAYHLLVSRQQHIEHIIKITKIPRQHRQLGGL